MSTKSPECWGDNPQARGLRIELAPGHTLTLPFSHFVLSELTTDDKEQHLRFVFATHEVLIHGHSLRRIDMAMQRLELGFIAKTANSKRGVEETQPVVCEIIVRAFNLSERQPDSLNP